MNNRKFQPVRTLSKLLNSASHQAFEQNLKAQKKAEAYYTVTPMPRVYSNIPNC